MRCKEKVFQYKFSNRFIFFTFGTILQWCKKYILPSTFLQNLVRIKIIKVFCRVSVVCTIILYSFSNKALNAYLIIRNGVLVINILLRFGFVTPNAFVNTIQKASENSYIHYYWGETVEMLKQSATKVVKSVFSNKAQQNHEHKVEKFNV